MTCRKAHGATFNPFIVFPRDRFKLEGELKHWESTPGLSRDFCAICGSPIVMLSEGEAELSLGSFDDVSLFNPQYETWTPHREAWLRPLDVSQFAENRVPAAISPARWCKT